MLCLSFNWCNRRHSRCGSHGDHLELIGISFPLCSLSLSHCSLSRCTRLIWVMYIRLIVPSSLSGIITSSTWHDLRWDERASIDRLVLCFVICFFFLPSVFYFLFSSCFFLVYSIIFLVFIQLSHMNATSDDCCHRSHHRHRRRPPVRPSVSQWGPQTTPPAPDLMSRPLQL